MLPARTYAAFASEMEKIAGYPNRAPIDRHDAAVYRQLVKSSPVPVRIDSEADRYGGGYFDQAKKEIGLSEKNFTSLAHEVGHAQLDEHLLGRIIQSRIARLAYTMTPLAAMGAGMLLAKGKKWGLLLPIATVAPTLISEHMATDRGGRQLEKLRASPDQIREYKDTLAKSFKTYLTIPIASAAYGAMSYLQG
jgi:hypothetical protein